MRSKALTGEFCQNQKKVLVQPYFQQKFVLASEEELSGLQDPGRCQAGQRGAGHVQAARSQPSMLLKLIGALLLCWGFSILRALHSHRAQQQHLPPVSPAPRLLFSEYAVSLGFSSPLPHSWLTLILLQQFTNYLNIKENF